MRSKALSGWQFVMSEIIILKIHSKNFLMCWNIILWIQWSHASYTYIKVLEEFSTYSHELLLLLQVTESDILWKVFVLVDRSLVASGEEVIVQWCHCVRAERVGSREAALPPPPCKEDAGSRLRKDMQQILPPCYCAPTARSFCSKGACHMWT
jgi:hypothetical protein